jgi:hypothetical protein
MQIINHRSASDPPTSARERRHGRTPRAGVLTSTAMAAALLAACGGSSSSGTVAHINTSTTARSSSKSKGATNPTTKPSLLALAKCMRAHGVPSFPDPKALSQIPTTQIPQKAPSGRFTAKPNSPAYQTASHHCKSLALARPVTQTVQGHVTAAQLKFAVCMRAHGLPNFPDPTNNGEIGNNGAISGVNPSSPPSHGAEEKCSKLRSLPPGLPGAGPSAGVG